MGQGEDNIEFNDEDAEHAPETIEIFNDQIQFNQNNLNEEIELRPKKQQVELMSPLNLQ